jgi:hypothetical protein
MSPPPPQQKLTRPLTRPQLAKALTAEGFVTSTGTLATKASRGGGPPYVRYGKYALYDWDAALAWAQARCVPMGCSTSERDSKPAIPAA